MIDVTRITASDINAGLKKRYCAPEWALFFNVANGTGWKGNRYADAIGMCLYPSRGLEIHGFEVKVSKSDFRREAADPSKAETMAAYCDRWWVVTPPKLLDGENLPPNWGWLAYDGRAFYTKQKAEKTPAKAPDRDFLAALLRRASESNDALLALQLAQKTAGMEAEIQRRAETQISNRTVGHKALQDAVALFEQKSGIKIETYGGSRIGDAVSVVLATGMLETYQNAGTLATSLRRTADQISEALKKSGFQPPENKS